MRTVHTSVILIVASLVWPAIGHAEDGVLADGRRIDGTLSTDAQGQVVFQPLGNSSLLRLDQLDQVRFPASRLPPLRAGAVCRVVLPAQQHLTGEFLGLDADRIQFRTIWSDLLSIPRAGVTAVTHAPGFVTVFADNFEKDLQCWRVTGALTLSSRQHVSGQHALCLDTPGQQVEYTLSVPLTTGRVGINFLNGPQDGIRVGRISNPSHHLAWHFEADFEHATGHPLTLPSPPPPGGEGRVRGSKVQVGIEPQTGDYTVEVSGAARGKSRLPRAFLAFNDNWQRLTMEFSPARLVLAIDEDILWSCQPSGLGGTLGKVRLSCIGSPLTLPSPPADGGEGRVRGERRGAGVCFDDFSVARAVPDLPHAKGDSGQDELWLLGGDQLFGDVVRATGGMIQLRGAFGPRSFRWGEVRGIYFRQQAVPPRQAGASRVRVWLRPGSGLEPDVLNGTVRRLDAQRLVLDHELLGRVEIDRQRLHRMRALVDERLRNEGRGP